MHNMYMEGTMHVYDWLSLLWFVLCMLLEGGVFSICRASVPHVVKLCDHFQRWLLCDLGYGDMADGGSPFWRLWGLAKSDENYV